MSTNQNAQFAREGQNTTNHVFSVSRRNKAIALQMNELNLSEIVQKYTAPEYLFSKMFKKYLTTVRVKDIFCFANHAINNRAAAKEGG